MQDQIEGKMIMEQETCLGQILIDGKWLDYARGTELEARIWQLGDPKRRRVVDWIDKDRVIVPNTEGK